MGSAAVTRKCLAATLAAATAVVCIPAGALAQITVVEYYHTDAIGNVRAVTNQAQQVVERHDYLPYGEEWCPGPPAGVCGSVTPGQAKRFTGKERDPETGLDYFGARYYGSKIGRFTTVDPVYTWQENLIDPQRWNRYAYARNNPLRYVDPDGRAIDTIADIGFIGWDLFDMGSSAYRGEGISGTQWLALGGDIVGAAIPFATGVGAAIRAGSSVEHAVDAGKVGSALITEYRAAGKAAEAKVAQELAEEGSTILGSQVCCRTPQGRRVIDHLTKDTSGNITAVEVKSGGATRNAAQRAKDGDIAAGKGTFVGKNAPPDLRGQQRAVPTIERKPAP